MIENKLEGKQAASALTGCCDRFEKDVSKSEDLVERARSATAAIDHLANHVEVEWMACEGKIAEALKAARSKKFALRTETRAMMEAFKDVRQFFLDDDYGEQIRRLDEFVSLCERLEKLKDSGFLDTVADTMLKLS